MRFYNRRGQAFPLIIAMVAILIIASLISANLGKVSLERLSCINSAHAGSLAGASDFVCGYNKVRIQHIAMLMVWGGIQAYLLIPVPFACFAYRHGMFVSMALLFNSRMYFYARTLVRQYSEGARMDAYWFAFDNSGVDGDDKYKVDGGVYRDKPYAQEEWRHWTSLRSAFSQWQLGLPDNWEFASSQTYQWYNASKAMTFSCISSPPENLRARKMPLIGLYFFPCLPFPLPLPHGMIHAWLRNPSTTMFVTMSVSRSHTQPERSLGFWSVRHPSTNSQSTSTMTGGFTSGFHLN